MSATQPFCCAGGLDWCVMQLFGGIRSFSVLSLLVLLFGLPLSAQRFVADFASRTSPSAKIIPRGIIAAQLGFLTGSASLNQLRQNGYAELRTNAQLPNIFLTSSTADWTQIDPTINLLKSAGLKTLIVMTFTPGWLQHIRILALLPLSLTTRRPQTLTSGRN